MSHHSNHPGHSYIDESGLRVFTVPTPKPTHATHAHTAQATHLRPHPLRPHALRPPRTRKRRA